MEAGLAVGASVIVIGLIVWARSASERALHRHAFDRRGFHQGPGIVKAKTTFVVPQRLASEVVATVVDALGYPGAKPGPACGVFLLNKTETEASFALGNRSHETWTATLAVTNGVGGAHGEYGVTCWLSSDGIPVAWKEMEIVSRRVGEVVSSMGGTVKVTVSPMTH